MKQSIVNFFLFLTCTFFHGCFNGESTGEIPPVSDFDLIRYMGKWYEIARYPHSFEQDLTHVSAEYSLNSDKTVTVINRGMKHGKPVIIRGIAKMNGPAEKGNLKVSFFRPFYGEYKIIFFNPERTVAVVTSSTKNYLWILAREKEIPREQMQKILTFLKMKGFPTDKLIMVAQK